MKTIAHTAAALFCTILLLHTVGCKEHEENVSAPKTDLGMNGFEDVTNSSGGGNTGTIPWDSVTISMGTLTQEWINEGDPILEARGNFTPNRATVHFRDIGKVILSSAEVHATKIQDSDSGYYEYRTRGRHASIPAVARPILGQLTQWKVPTNTYGIPPLDTMLYTLPPLNVQMVGQQMIYDEERVATTGTLNLAWQPDAQADWVRVEVTYDGSEPSNRDRNQPNDWRIFQIILPGSSNGITIPPAVLGKLPPRGAVFRINVRRQKRHYFPHGGKYVSMLTANTSDTRLITL